MEDVCILYFGWQSMLSEISLHYQNMSILDSSLQLAEEMWLLWAWETRAKKTEATILFVPSLIPPLCPCVYQKWNYGHQKEKGETVDEMVT